MQNSRVLGGNQARKSHFGSTRKVIKSKTSVIVFLNYLTRVANNVTSGSQVPPTASIAGSPPLFFFFFFLQSLAYFKCLNFSPVIYRYLYKI